jgi:hypothetical protein
VPWQGLGALAGAPCPGRGSVPWQVLRAVAGAALRQIDAASRYCAVPRTAAGSSGPGSWPRHPKVPAQNCCYHKSCVSCAQLQCRPLPTLTPPKPPASLLLTRLGLRRAGDPGGGPQCPLRGGQPRFTPLWRASSAIGLGQSRTAPTHSLWHQPPLLPPTPNPQTNDPPKPQVLQDMLDMLRDYVAHQHSSHVRRRRPDGGPRQGAGGARVCLKGGALQRAAPASAGAA